MEPARLVFIDETGAKTNMTRAYARARTNMRAVDHAPHGHWNTSTLVAETCQGGAIAPMMLDGPKDTEAFFAYVRHCLIPALPKDAIVAMDNLSAHKASAIQELLKEARATLRYLPPYSPDFNPIELMWFKVKTYLRATKARTYDELQTAIAQALAKITPQDTKGSFHHCFAGMIT